MLDSHLKKLAKGASSLAVKNATSGLPPKSLKLQATTTSSKSITLSTAGLAGPWALKLKPQLVQNPRWPLGHTSAHLLTAFFEAAQTHESLAMPKPISAVRELFRASKAILTFVKGVGKKK